MFLITGCDTTCCLNRLGKKTTYTTLLKNLNSGTNNLSDLQYFREADDTVCVSVAARANEGMHPGRLFPEGCISRKIKIHLVYGPLNVLQLAISVHQRYCDD